MQGLRFLQSHAKMESDSSQTCVVKQSLGWIARYGSQKINAFFWSPKGSKHDIPWSSLQPCPVVVATCTIPDFCDSSHRGWSLPTHDLSTKLGQPQSCGEFEMTATTSAPQSHNETSPHPPSQKYKLLLDPADISAPPLPPSFFLLHPCLTINKPQ